MNRIFYLLILFVFGCSSEYELFAKSETISFEPGTEVDALVVLDTSCSMLDDEEHVIAGTMAIGADLWELELDARLAFTSSDVTREGWEEVDLTQESVVDIVIDTGTAIFSLPSDGIEAGFSSALNIVNLKASFFRDEAIKLLIFVSDEREQSDITVEEFYDLWPFNTTYILSIAGDPDAEYQIIDEDSPYQRVDCRTDPTPKYYNVADSKLNLCRDTPWRIQDVLPR